MFIIGEEVFASESDYAGLLGRITEIRTGEDRDTENEGPDIYCNFQPPILNQDAEQIEPWEIHEAVRRTAINDPSLYSGMQSALSSKEQYKEEYSEAISEVAHTLTKEHANIETMLKKQGRKVSCDE